MEQAAVYFDDGLERLNAFVEANSARKFFFLVDENTHEFCLPLLLSELPEIADLEIVEVPVGEESKSIEVVVQVWETLSELGANRYSVVVNCGGGVVTDLGGFVASVFKRGIRFIQVPTSLLAMVDASVGGKTGINLNHLKNQIGTFAQAEMVVIYPDFLATLPEKELRSGFAEMLKHGLIRDAAMWHELVALDELNAEALAPFIERSVQIKKEIVDQDPTEKGLRRILNAGHTLGHGLESWFMDNDLEITHGDAVAAGLLLESFVSWQKDLMVQEEFDEIFEGIQKFYPRLELPDLQEVMPYLRHDKKNVGEVIQFVLIEEIGNCQDRTFSADLTLLADAWTFYKNMYQG